MGLSHVQQSAARLEAPLQPIIPYQKTRVSQSVSQSSFYITAKVAIAGDDHPGKGGAPVEDTHQIFLCSHNYVIAGAGAKGGVGGKEPCPGGEVTAAEEQGSCS